MRRTLGNFATIDANWRSPLARCVATIRQLIHDDPLVLVNTVYVHALCGGTKRALALLKRWYRPP